MIYMMNTTSFEILFIGERDHCYRGQHISIEGTEKYGRKTTSNGLVYPWIELNHEIVQ